MIRIICVITIILKLLAINLCFPSMDGLKLIKKWHNGGKISDIKSAIINPKKQKLYHDTMIIVNPINCLHLVTAFSMTTV